MRGKRRPTFGPTYYKVWFVLEFLFLAPNIALFLSHTYALYYLDGGDDSYARAVVCGLCSIYTTYMMESDVKNLNLLKEKRNKPD